MSKRAEQKLLASIPLYSQLSSILKRNIEEGKWNTGEKIPSESRLCSMFSVSRITVRAAVDKLVEDGILIKIQGKGTFVANQPNKKLLSIGNLSFEEMCHENSMTPGRLQLHKEMEEANEDDIARLKLKKGDKVLALKRILLANEQPLIISTDRIHPKFSFIMEEDMEKNSLNKLMLGSGLISKFQPSYRSIEVCMASDQEAEWLKIRAGATLLLLRDIMLDENNEPVRYTKELLVADKIRITYH